MATDPLDSALDALLHLALAEDGCTHDLTSLAAVPADARGRGRLVAREDGVFCGAALLAPAPRISEAFPGVRIRSEVADGHALSRGQLVAALEGPARELLGLERTLLNFLQRLCGIATTTRRYVEAAGGRAQIQETRKTCPGWRVLDKHAVRSGGGLNHRMGLHDQVLLKENHLVFSEREPRDPEAVRTAVAAARARFPGTVIEVEVETLEQFEAALESGADIIMLDEFEDAQIERAVARRRESGSPALLEVSGGVRLERVAKLASLGVDRLSVGALTHSVQALDLALELDFASPA